MTKVQVRLGGTLYTYAVDGAVAAGDIVAIPAPDWNPDGGDQEVAVAEVGSDYDGPLTRARVVRRAAKTEPRYPATPARVAADLRDLGYLVASRDGELGWRVYWATDAQAAQAVRVELPGTPANAAGGLAVRDSDLNHLAAQLRELGWLAVVKPAGWIVVTATTAAPGGGTP
jgi:hypothetical protein